MRVYSDWGFVPHNYKYSCQIQHVEAVKEGDNWVWSLAWGRAQRRMGQAAKVVVR